MKDINLRTDDLGGAPTPKGSFQLLIDPVYGPNSKYFWPGRHVHARKYIIDPTRPPVYVSGKEFLDIYAEEFSGVLDYRELTDYLDESYCETLYDHFYSLYNDVQSWESSTLFVSAVYRGLFHEMFPYQSQLCELKTRLEYESITKPLLKRNLYDEAIFAGSGKRVKESDKVKRKLSYRTFFGLMRLILYPYTDRSLIVELLAVLNRTNIVATHQRELTKGFLLELDFTNGITFLSEETRRDVYRERLLWGLSLLQIGSNAAEKAVDDSLSSLSYGPIISLIQAHSSHFACTSEENSFVSDTALAYYIAPRYTATDYIRDLVLSEEAYTKIFEEVQDSAATWRPTSVLMSFEEEGQKLAQLAFGDMIRELFQENTSLLSIVDPAAKTLDEEELTNTEQISLEKIFSKIGEKIDVPFAARKRIIEICNERGIPDKEVLAFETIFEAWPINKSKKNKIDAVVSVFALLLVYTLGFFFLNKSHKRFSVNAQSYQVTQIDMETEVKAETEKDSVSKIDRLEDGSPILRDTFKQVPLPKQMASPSIPNWGKFVSGHIREEKEQPRRKPKWGLQRPIVASGKKKTFNFKSKSPSFVVTKGDESKFKDIFIRETFDSNRNEVNITGSVGSYYRCIQLRDTAGTVARNSNSTLLPVQFDHSWSSRFRQGANLLIVPKADITTVEAVPYPIHQLLTNCGADMFSLEPGVISFDDFHNKIFSERVTIFQSQKAIDIMANQLHGMFKSQDFIDASERSAVRNRRLLHFIASKLGVNTDSVKSLIYPKQLYTDSMRRMKGVRTRLVSLENLQSKNSPEIQKELKALLEFTQDSVAENISIINQLRSSQSYLAGTAQDAIQQSFVNKLVAAHNDLVDLAAHLHNISGTPCTASSRGKILTLAAAIDKADEKGYTDQWLKRGATPMEDQLVTKESLNSQVSLILSTNNLSTDPPLVGKESRFL